MVGASSSPPNMLYVVTAAHCLGKLPEAYAARDYFEAAQQDFLGPLGGPRDVWAECVFMDPIADIAVFGTPDNQELSKQAQAYETLTEQATPFLIGRLDFSRRRKGSRKASFTVEGVRRDIVLPPSSLREAESEAQMLSLDGEWFKCRVRSMGRSLWFDQAEQPIIGGMSGSPIVLPDGGAVGVVCVSEDSHARGREPVEGPAGDGASAAQARAADGRRADEGREQPQETCD